MRVLIERASVAFASSGSVPYGDERHWTSDNRGVSEWTIRGTQASGEPIEVRGWDLFEFTGGKISRKDSFWKACG